MTTARLVWNRAALERGGPAARRGDRSLAAVILFHGLVMNGGVEHARECLTAGERFEAQTGYRRYGLAAIVELLSETAKGTDAEQDARYWRVIPNDDALVASFEADFSRDPEAYAPAQPT